ncbi:hypothetical protein [Streptomyces sp. NPDC060194]|uniref:hypothetical protein n=1 Tax=Streptomyces sp. NPDC060194 TaxID=3347069 RepID=UPI003650A39D
MTDWGIALIAAGSALAGSIVTGWFARSAGGAQAAAARHAGDRQADALLETVRRTLRAQDAVRTAEARRRTYAAFLLAAGTAATAARSGRADAADGGDLDRALALVALEGPDEVEAAARHLAAALRRSARPDDVEDARRGFVAAVRAASGAVG